MCKEKCSWSVKCRNGNNGCWTLEPENCVRYMPLEGTNLTEMNVVVETPPDIDWDKFSQYFTNWVESMGWSYVGSFKPYEEDDEDDCI